MPTDEERVSSRGGCADRLRRSEAVQLRGVPKSNAIRNGLVQLQTTPKNRPKEMRSTTAAYLRYAAAAIKEWLHSACVQQTSAAAERCSGRGPSCAPQSQQTHTACWCSAAAWTPK